jgi:hypothetical protein
MEISNLIAESFYDMAALSKDSVQTAPWSDFPWAEHSMEILRNLYANSIFADKVQCTFDSTRR